MKNRDIRIGRLDQVQGCIERGLEVLNNSEITYDKPSETRSSTIYKFCHQILGDIGDVKLSVYEEDTEIYYYPSTEPDEKETKKFLLNNVNQVELDQPSLDLLRICQEEEKLGITDMTPIDLIKDGLQGDYPKVDLIGFYPGDLKKVHAANQALEEWRKKIRQLRRSEFSLVQSAIVGQLNLEGIISLPLNKQPPKKLDLTLISKKEPVIEPKNKKKREPPKLPSRVPNAYKWVLIWEEIGEQIKKDPTLKIDIDELKLYLNSKNLQTKEDTLRKIIEVGNKGEIPNRLAFEQDHNL